MKKLLVLLSCMAVITAAVTGCGSTENSEPVSQVQQQEVTEAPADIQDDEKPDGADDIGLPPADLSGTSDGQLSAAIAEIFRTEIESGDIKAVAEKIAAGVTDFGLVTEDCAEGYLPGFSQDVKGFKDGVKAAPMIGSIPCVIYIFEADDAEAFLETLDSIADPRWNICTEAKDITTEVSGNYVLYAMCPGEE